MAGTTLDMGTLVRTYLRADVVVTTPDASDVVFTPSLTAPEQAVFADLVLMNKFGVTMTLVEWQGIKADAAALKAYNGVATPTLVQTAAAVKAINRVLATIVRS